MDALGVKHKLEAGVVTRAVPGALEAGRNGLLLRGGILSFIVRGFNRGRRAIHAFRSGRGSRLNRNGAAARSVVRQNLRGVPVGS
ncbi:MAG: hypothetical protein LBM77_11745 [Spirochaetaceae bacterium]|nr:hypothetical protein [Spirochaetaceae bacterium]